jgi:putative hemolysin
MDTIWLEMILIAVGILANGFFAGSEFALVSARQARLTRLRDQSVRGAATALSLKRDPETFLATIQIAITLVGTLASAVGGATAIEALTPWLAGLPVPGARQWAEPVALAIVILTIAYVSLVLGELAPKALALRNPERVACRVARPVQALVRAAAWPGRILTVSTRAVLRLLRQGEAPAAPLVSEDEVKYLVREGVSHGVFEHHESELVHRVFQFTDTPVRAVMVPRPEELQGLELQGRRPISPGRLQRHHDPPIRPEPEAVLRQGRAQQIPAQPLQPGAIIGGHPHVRVKIEPVEVRRPGAARRCHALARAGRRAWAVPCRADSTTLVLTSTCRLRPGAA